MRLARLLAPVFALTLALPSAGCLGSTTITDPPAVTTTVETTTFAPSLGIDLNAAGWTRTTTGLYYRTVTPGADAAATAAAGQRVTLRYTLWLSNGTLLPPAGATLDPFTLGSGTVIAGFEQGIPGMRVGEKRRLLIPPALAYGDRGAGNGTIPPNAVLVFDVELLSVG